MPKFDVLKAMAGRKESESEMGFWRHSGNTSIAFIRNQLYNLVVYLAILKHMGRGGETVYPMYNSSEML